MTDYKQPLVLAILDGWGIGPKDRKTNAIHAARTKFFDHAMKNYPSTQLKASGKAVGLEEDQMSGSETGHLNIGAGRMVIQDVRLILEAIDNGSFFHNPVFLGTIEHARKHESNIHLVGLLGNEDSPHAHPDILLALLILLKKHQFEGKVFLHLFTDGRDSFPRSAKDHWRKWKKMVVEKKMCQLASVSGRFYGMDRSKNWDRLMKAYDAIVAGKGEKYTKLEEVLDANYKKNRTDEYIKPAVLIKGGKPVGTVKDGDGVIFFNFRSDRARQFSKLFVGTNTKKENGFPKIKPLKNLSFVAMTNFGPDLNLKTAYPSNPLSSTLPAVLKDKKQLYIAETEKFAHVTYFINGGYSEAIGGEDRVMIASPKVRSYADQPQMSAIDVADVITKSLLYGVYEIIVVNFANADMVGHTGDFNATKKAVQVVDKQLIKIYKEIRKRDGILLITADHGNADVMVDKGSGRPFTFHTKNPVPLVLISDRKQHKNIKLMEGSLSNIAPTILELTQTNQPEEMLADSLIN